MKQREQARTVKAFLILLLCFPLPLRAATSEDFIQGYASAVLEREFRIKNFSLNVTGDTIRIKSAELPDAGHDKIMAALLSIDGVKRVTIVDSFGTVVASSTPQQQATQRALEPKSDKREFELGFLPGGNLFEPLVADPRWPRFSMAYEYFPSDRELESVGRATFGETIALYRGRGPAALWEVGFHAGVFSIFDLNAPSNDLINTDFLAGLQASYRIDDVTTLFRIFHQSSHLGDEFLLRNRIDRINLSFDGIDVKLSYRPFDWLRLYGGAGYLFNRDPSDLNPWGTQGGIELQTPRRYWRDSVRLVAAVDLKNWEENKWSTEISVRGGLQFERPLSFMRKISLLFEYYKGHSPNGQFFNRKVEYFGPGLHLDF
jgi:hypothetical protein